MSVSDMREVGGGGGKEEKKDNGGDHDGRRVMMMNMTVKEKNESDVLNKAAFSYLHSPSVILLSLYPYPSLIPLPQEDKDRIPQ